MNNFEKYNKLHDEIISRLENGEITTETAKEVNDLLFDKYIVNDGAEIIEESVFDLFGITWATLSAIIVGCIGYTVTNTIGGKINLKRCAKLLKESDSSFIDPKDMTVKRYKVKSLIDHYEKKKEVNNKLLKVLYKFFNHIDVYSYKGKEIFAFTRSTDYSYDLVEKHVYFNLIDKSMQKYEKFYLAYSCNKANVKNIEAYKWAKNFLKEYDKESKEKEDEKQSDND